MPTPFPGMDPYLEHPNLWKEVHTGLIIEIQKYLTPRLRPKYRVAVEQRSYLETVDDELFIGLPDVLVRHSPSITAWETYSGVATATLPSPYVVDLPMPEEIIERYLEIREVVTGQVVTVIEILSLSNKLPGAGRREYVEKRLAILSSKTHLIEIDLLRAGRPLPIRGNAPTGQYRILISRAVQRPKATIYPVSLSDPVPDLPIPLLAGDSEPILPLNQLLHELYDQAGYDLAIRYDKSPTPELSTDEALWMKALLGVA